MAIAPVPAFPFPRRPFSSITPFTYSDAMTHLELLEKLRVYAGVTLPAEINKVLDKYSIEITAEVQAAIDLMIGTLNDKINEINDALADQKADYTQKIADLIVYVDDAVQQVINNSIELQDPVMAGIIADSSSLTNEAAHALVSEFVPARTAFSGDTPTEWGPASTIISRAQLVEVMSPAAQGTVPYIPHIISVPISTPGRLGNYYLYWSTDHAPATGGIHMAYADHPMGPWTTVKPHELQIPDWMRGLEHSNDVNDWREFYHRNNTAYTDTGYHDLGGGQTEGPWVMPDLTGERRFVMYYQQQLSQSFGDTYGSQVTMFAKSDDGITWVRGSKPLVPRGSTNDIREALALIYPPRLTIPGNGHSGYASFYDIGQYRISYASAGGSNWSRQGFYVSGDGMTFRMDPRRLSYRADMTGSGDLKITGLFGLFQWRGELWGNTRVQTPGSGGSSPATSQQVVGRMRPDLRNFAGSVHETNWASRAVIDGGDGYLYGVGTQGDGNARTIIVRRLRA